MNQEPEILPPGAESSSTEIVPSQSLRTWVVVKYNIAVLIAGGNRANEIGLAPLARAEKVFGRAMGERSDGGCFFSSVDLPWVWDDPLYDWRTVARSRLDTFLIPECECETRESEIVTCKLHEEYMIDWTRGDRGITAETRVQLNQMPYAKYGDGPLPGWTVMHADYPWCREQRNRGLWRCFICQGSAESFMNPSWRSVFVNRHSHCGFGGRGGTEKVTVVNRNLLAQKLGAAVCENCSKPCYTVDGVLFHNTGYRSCNWAHTSYAEAA